MTAFPEPMIDTSVSHDAMANAIRALSMDAVQRANSGHPGMPMGMADVATVLFNDILKYNPKHPEWPDRDRFVLSAGHGSMLLYALLHLTGYEDMTMDEIKRFRQWGAKTAGHPEYGHAAGIETTTGPLGQGLANAVGMALTERMMAAEFGADLVNHHTYVIAGDGCLMEGISQEAISLAGHLKLNKLIVLFDDNSISIDGPTSLTVSEDTLKRFESCGWHATRINGHDSVAIAQALYAAKVSDKPTLIACKTTIAKGAPTKAGTSASHGSPLGDAEIAGARETLGWSSAPFEIPADILAAWREAGTRSQGEYDAWSKRFETSAKADEFASRVAGDLPEGWVAAMAAFKQKLIAESPKQATRQSSQLVLDVLAPAVPALLGGSADLTGSNNTKAVGMDAVKSPRYDGKYMYYGVREHGMAAMMNGIALHGGYIPYGGTFLVFTDYCRGAIRLSALMQQRVIYVMTHDSIGLGEDGPTHQPVEHLASLRAIPNLNVFRPCDATETAECWELALSLKDTPSILALSRQAVPHLRREFSAENKSALGAYVIHSSSRGAALAHASDVSAGSGADAALPLRAPQHDEVVLIGTGTEVSLCVEAAEALAKEGINVRVVSMPCWELFAQQPASYQREVLGDDGVLKIACEAALSFGWERWIGNNGIFIGMNGFGASAPAPELYEHFGITAQAMVDAVKNFNSKK